MQLPPDECALLAELRSDLPHLRARVRKLRDVGWTLSSIGLPLGAPRSTVRSWATHPVHSLVPVPAPAPPVPPAPPAPPSSAPRTPLPPDATREISLLAPVASTFRALSSPDSPAARARARLDQLVSHHHSLGVPTSHLARAARVSYRAMYVRVQRTQRAA